jgi:hypothetical protein
MIMMTGTRNEEVDTGRKPFQCGTGTFLQIKNKIFLIETNDQLQKEIN